MNTWTSKFRLAGALALLVPLANAEPDTQALTNSSVRVFCFLENDKIMGGSGFLVGKDGKFVLTNAHVVKGCTKIGVMSPRENTDPKIVGAEVRWDSKKSMTMQHLDAALLELNESVGGPGVAFATKETVAIRDQIVAVGYPVSADSVSDRASISHPSITQGTISSIKRQAAEEGQPNSGGVVLYQITASIGPGNSGGPLFNYSGEVIGINTEKALVSVVSVDADGKPEMTRVPSTDGVAWAQQIDEILPVLDANHIAYAKRTSRPNWFGQWVNRDPVTAIGVCVVVALLLAALGVLLLRSPARPVVPPPGPPPPPDHPPAPPPERSRLGYAIGAEGPHAGQRFPVTSDVIFGRDASCNVVFGASNDGIGRRHCSLRFDAARGEFELLDLGSANGTFVNGQKLDSGERRRLRDGDEFYLFKTKYRFTVRIATGTKPPAPRPPQPSNEHTVGVGNWRPN